MLNILKFSYMREIVESWLVHVNLVPPSFSYFLEILWKKKKISLKSVMVITAITLCIVKNLFTLLL